MTSRYYVPDLGQRTAFALPPEEARHAAAVMRVAVGDRITVFDGDGHEGLAEVVAAHKRGVDCVLVEALREINRERSPAIHLAVALPKGDRQKVLVEKAVELGATSLTPLLCQRSVVRAESGAQERLQRAVIEASKQCGRNRLMQIGTPCRAVDFAKQVGQDAGLCVIAHPYGDQALELSELRERAHDELLLSRWMMVGPEGGFTDDEIAEVLAVAPWQCVCLGPRILRTETAALALLAWG